MAEKKGETKVYYARGVGKYTVNIPVWDENGKPKMRENKFGQHILDKVGNPVAITRKLVFPTVISNPLAGSYCKIEVADVFDIKYLDKLVEDGTTSVVSEKQFEKERNALAFNMKEKYEAEKERREALEKETNDIIKRANAKIEQLEVELKKKGK